jgi:hypothetical protein
MRSFTLHAKPPPPRASVPAAGTRVQPKAASRLAGLPVVVPEGFSLFAALLPAPWFLLHRLWLPLVLYIAFNVLAAYTLPGPVLPFLTVALQVLIGFEAQNIRRWVLARRGLAMAGVVVARDAEAALLRALDARPDLAGRGIA